MTRLAANCQANAELTDATADRKRQNTRNAHHRNKQRDSRKTSEHDVRAEVLTPDRLNTIDLLTVVVVEGAVMAVAGVVAGAAGGYALVRLAGGYFTDVQIPGTVPLVAAAVVLLAAAVVASVVPAARAARVDVMQHSGRTKHAAAKVGKQNWQCRPPLCL